MKCRKYLSGCDISVERFLNDSSIKIISLSTGALAGQYFVYNGAINMTISSNAFYSPFFELLGIKVEYSHYPFARLTLLWDKSLTNSLGIVHGGVIASLVDAALGYVLLQKKEEIKGIATIEAKVNYLKSITKGLIIAEAEIVHKGSFMAYGQAHIYNDGELAAIGSATYKLTFTGDKNKRPE